LDTSSEHARASLHLPIEKRAISNPAILNEAYTETKPKSYSRGMRIDLNGLTVLLISGTFSSDAHGNTVHIGDFGAQVRRTLDNITGLLAVEDCTWHDVVRTTCFLRDIDRDYDVFNEVRTAFFKEQKLDLLPASTGVQAKLSRPDLLVEIEAIVMFRTKGSTGDGNE
jgi:2-iminobutanoate/2-iminopropanoate deaminase